MKPKIEGIDRSDRSAREIAPQESAPKPMARPLTDTFEHLIDPASKRPPLRTTVRSTGAFEVPAAAGTGRGGEAAVPEPGAGDEFARQPLPPANLEFANVPIASSAPAAPASSESAARHLLVQRLVRAIEGMVARGDQQMSFDVETGTLGLRGVQLVREADGRLGLVLRVATDAPVEGLQKFRAELVEALRAQGLTVRSAEIAAAATQPPTRGDGQPASRERDREERRPRSQRTDGSEASSSTTPARSDSDEVFG